MTKEQLIKKCKINKEEYRNLKKQLEILENERIDLYDEIIYSDLTQEEKDDLERQLF
jgi:predicted metal-dependent TIM-barrel fold hydrolase